MAEADQGQESAVRSLLAAGVSANSVDANGSTPLMTAAAFGWPSMIGILTEAGADIDAKDHEGRTALMYAITQAPDSSRFDLLKTIEVVLAANPDLAIQDNSGKTATTYAMTVGLERRIKALIALRGATEKE